MTARYRVLAAIVAALALAASSPLALGQGKSDKGGANQTQTDKGGGKGKEARDGADKVKKVKGNHHSGKDMLGEKVKANGRHVIDKKGDYAAAVDVKDGKIAGMKVTHATKGDVPVTKYKTDKKMALVDSVQLARADGRQQRAAFVPVQAYSLGTTYIGYAYVDEYGVEEIYWYPYEMILDGDTGAIDYVPMY